MPECVVLHIPVRYTSLCVGRCRTAGWRVNRVDAMPNADSKGLGWRHQAGFRGAISVTPYGTPFFGVKTRVRLLVAACDQGFRMSEYYRNEDILGFRVKEGLSCVFSAKQ